MESHPFIPRMLQLAPLLERKSHFLFGPLQTGKSWLMSYTPPACRVYNLLDSTTFLNLSRNPSQIAQELRPGERLIVIDEIQRLPGLLNEVHLQIEECGVRFLLTGSSGCVLIVANG